MVPDDRTAARPHKITAFYEVHHWPHLGEVLVIDKQPWRDRPVLTWLNVRTAGERRADGTVAIAHALAAAVAFDVEATCVLHDRFGSMFSTPAGLGLPVTALKRVQ